MASSPATPLRTFFNSLSFRDERPRLFRIAIVSRKSATRGEAVCRKPSALVLCAPVSLVQKKFFAQRGERSAIRRPERFHFGEGATGTNRFQRRRVRQQTGELLDFQIARVE